MDPERSVKPSRRYLVTVWTTSRPTSSLDINIAVLSCPSRIASDLVVPIVNAGIKGVLNFASKPLNFPLGIVVENYDITTLLEKVAYFVKENEENNEM